MFENKTSDSIYNDMLDDIETDLDKSIGSFIYDVTKPPANEIAKAYVALDSVITKLTIDNLTGDELATRIYERIGSTRKPAVKATTSVTVTGSNGALINIGDKVASDKVNYIFQEAKTITTGNVTVLVECEQAGAIGNVPIGAIKYFPVTLAGLTTVTNSSSVANGFDAESDADYLKRYYEHIQVPSTSGNSAMYKSLAKEINGVGDARVIPLWNGNNTVKILIINANKQPADNTLVAQVQTYIDPSSNGFGEGKAPIGAFCTVVSATAININVSFTLTKDPVYTLPQVTANVNAAITDYMKSIAFVASQVSYAKVSNAIFDAKGVVDISGLTINGGVSNITIASDKVAILGTLTIT